MAHYLAAGLAWAGFAIAAGLALGMGGCQSNGLTPGQTVALGCIAA